LETGQSAGAQNRTASAATGLDLVALDQTFATVGNVKDQTLDLLRSTSQAGDVSVDGLTRDASLDTASPDGDFGG